MLFFVTCRFVRSTGENTSGEVVPEACTRLHILISRHFSRLAAPLDVELSVLSAMSVAQATPATDVS